MRAWLLLDRIKRLDVDPDHLCYVIASSENDYMNSLEQLPIQRTKLNRF